MPEPVARIIATMFLGLFKRWRRARIRDRPFPLNWENDLVRNVGHYAFLNHWERRHLRDLVQVFVAEKQFFGCDGLAMTDEIRVTIAGGACLLLLGIEHDNYRNVREILVFPAARIVETSEGLLRHRVSMLGQAHSGGPVLLGWDAARQGCLDPRDGRNLVFHEFAHKLDMLDGIVDGTPPLRDRLLLEDWVKVMTAEYQRLQEQARRGEKTLLDHYGAKNPAEFFAVATEIFFEKPGPMRQEQPALYDLLKQFYKQDPACRIYGTTSAAPPILPPGCAR